MAVSISHAPLTVAVRLPFSVAARIREMICSLP